MIEDFACIAFNYRCIATSCSSIALSGGRLLQNYACIAFDYPFIAASDESIATSYVRLLQTDVWLGLEH
jgi:hypothetical protein